MGWCSFVKLLHCSETNAAILSAFFSSPPPFVQCDVVNDKAGGDVGDTVNTQTQTSLTSITARNGHPVPQLLLLLFLLQLTPGGLHS